MGRQREGGTLPRGIAGSVDAIALTVGNSGMSINLETCRRKRNVVDDTRAHVATDSEADEIVKTATELNDLVNGWIEARFPEESR